MREGRGKCRITLQWDLEKGAPERKLTAAGGAELLRSRLAVGRPLLCWILDAVDKEIRSRDLRYSLCIHRLGGARILDKLDEAGPDGKWQATFDTVVDLLFEKFPRQEMGLWLEQVHDTCRLYPPRIQRLAKHYRSLPDVRSRNRLY